MGEMMEKAVKQPNDQTNLCVSKKHIYKHFFDEHTECGKA